MLNGIQINQVNDVEGCEEANYCQQEFHVLFGLEDVGEQGDEQEGGEGEEKPEGGSEGFVA